MSGLTPHGTARQRIFDGPRDEELRSAPRFPNELRAALREHDLGEEMLMFAWELARLTPGLSALEERALLYLGVSSLVNARQGSTRLPVSGSEGLSHLDELFRSLGAGDAELACARELLAELRQARLAGKAGRIGAVVGLPGDYKPLVLDGYTLYHQRMLDCEDRLVARLRARLERAQVVPDGLEAALADVQARPATQRERPIELSGEQLHAVRTALGRPLTVISGGPGTGKTSIVASLLRVLPRIGVPLESVALAAPTGKAAYRMRQSIERSLRAVASPSEADLLAREQIPEARTLHRLLGYSPTGDRFRHHENNRLSERVIVVDEGSMIDLYLMDRLMRAVRDDACLIILGDADQLPSVEAGAVFRDILPQDGARFADDPRAGAAVRLTRSYRMSPSEPAGRNILMVAARINAGDAGALLDGASAEADAEQTTGHAGELIGERAHAAELAFERVERLDGGARAAEFYERWYHERVRALPEFDRLTRKVYHHGDSGFDAVDTRDLQLLFDHFERFRLLCLTRGDHLPTGAAHVNAVLHRKVLEHARRADDERGTPTFYPGEPILMLENDYDRGLFNGDQGLVLRVSEDERGGPHHYMAVFPRQSDFGVFHLDSLRAVLELAFAMTVHKSQGSELDYVGVVLPDDDLPLNTRELLYTAVTRSRRSVVLLGSREILRRGITRRIRRFSGIAGKLAKR